MILELNAGARRVFTWDVVWRSVNSCGEVSVLNIEDTGKRPTSLRKTVNRRFGEKAVTCIKQMKV